MYQKVMISRLPHISSRLGCKLGHTLWRRRIRRGFAGLGAFLWNSFALLVTALRVTLVGRLGRVGTAARGAGLLFRRQVNRQPIGIHVIRRAVGKHPYHVDLFVERRISCRSHVEAEGSGTADIDRRNRGTRLRRGNTLAGWPFSGCGELTAGSPASPVHGRDHFVIRPRSRGNRSGAIRRPHRRHGCHRARRRRLVGSPRFDTPGCSANHFQWPWPLDAPRCCGSIGMIRGSIVSNSNDSRPPMLNAISVCWTPPGKMDDQITAAAAGCAKQNSGGGVSKCSASSCARRWCQDLQGHCRTGPAGRAADRNQARKLA